MDNGAGAMSETVKSNVPVATTGDADAVYGDPNDDDDVDDAELAVVDQMDIHCSSSDIVRGFELSEQDREALGLIADDGGVSGSEDETDGGDGGDGLEKVV